MSNFIEAGQADEVKDGMMKKASIQNKEILIARVNGKYYAVDNRCPHFGGELSQGKLEGTIVTCPRHGSQFDLADGQVVRWLNMSGFIAKVSKALKPQRPLVAYKVKIEDNKILIEM